MTPGRRHIHYVPGVKCERLGEFLPPCNDRTLSNAGSAAKHMARDVITLCKYTKEEVSEGRKEECKDNVGTAIQTFQPEVYLDIRQKSHNLQGEKSDSAADFA